MKKRMRKLLKKVVYGISYPISLFTLMILTKVIRIKSFNGEKFLIDFLKSFENEIKNYLKIDSCPEIRICYVPKEINKGYYREVIYASYDRNRSLFDLSNNFNFDRTIVSPYKGAGIIKIYINSIIKVYNHTYLAKIKIIDSIIHELTHFKQNTLKDKIEEYDAAINYNTYYNLKVEKQARIKASKFIFKYLPKIVLMLIK